MKIVTSTLKNISRAMTIVALSVFASQCFAQSQALSADSKEADRRKYLEIINSLYYYIQEKYVDEVDARVLYEGALRGMLGSLDDPYSVYMDKSEWRNITDTTNGSFGGVGLVITKERSHKETKPSYVLVVNPVDNSPGDKAGIRAGDYIIKINGTDTSTITMDEVLDRLRGTPGESVDVTIRRKDVEFERTLVREIIENQSVKAGFIENTKIGYIKLTEFASGTTQHFLENAEKFKKEGMTALIIDLRNNGGGLLQTAVQIADTIIDEGKIVETKSRYANNGFSAESKTTILRDMPVVVLINGASASASEILTGALKDHKKAYIMGEKSYGKGSVQVPTGLFNNDGFKITVAKYYSPSDVNIDKIGIQPDKEVLFPELSESEQAAWKKLVEDDVIERHVKDHPDMTEKEISAFAIVLRKKYKIDDRVIRKLIRNEVDMTKPSRLYDLDYDVQLKSAIEVLQKTGDFSSLLKNTKTLAEQKAEADARAEKENSDKK